MPYWELYYHIVWSTKNREPMITEELESDLHQYLRGKGISLEGIIHAVGGIEDHVHVAASIPPKIALADFISDLKGASSHWVNHVHGHSYYFGWQTGLRRCIVR
ncbi:IS200/IS605 family transposase [candidate division KSB1 bacterium]|nr:IS200/IS605 family transposase [candidate division KSB1 bacterium]NIR70593.1 IS200/IS605 family transposase [candidate division KSB1 bacterium]NIS24538.1 IS200/IS605 family transposase [candidate division KSB1 bacterium]NIT71456.1 IS200/IS605 family transposase [candidate division KSB1 bacterium]NIU25147.1 IS200/IS605 family transposase [candidate division KSB1 bacterium]